MDKCQSARHMRQRTFGTKNKVKRSAEVPKFFRNEEMAVSAVVARHVTWHRPPHWPAPQPRQPPCKERRASPLAAFLKWRTCRAPGEASPAPAPAPAAGLFFSPPPVFFLFSPSFPLRWSFYKPLQIWVETDFSQLALRLNFTAQHTLRHCQKLDSVPGKILTVNFPTGIEGTHGSRQDVPLHQARRRQCFHRFPKLALPQKPPRPPRRSRFAASRAQLRRMPPLRRRSAPPASRSQAGPVEHCMLWCINICLWLKFKQPSVAARHNRKPTSKGKCLLQPWPKQRLPASKPLASARPAGAYHKVPGRPPPRACHPSREMVNLFNAPVRPRLRWQPGVRVCGMRGTHPPCGLEALTLR